MAIPDHFTIQFGKNFSHVAQQTQSRLKKAAVVDNSVTGEAKTHNLIGEVEDTEVTGQRFGDTVGQELSSEKRWNRPQEFELVTFAAPFDEVLLAPTILPGGEHLTAHRSAYARRLDRVFIDGAFGTNYKGKAGVTAAEIPNENIVAVDFVSSGSAVDSSLSVDKIIRAKRILRDNESYGDDAVAAGLTLWGAMTPEMEERLLFLANASNGSSANRLFSRDFMPPSLDANGNISSFLGVNWIRSSYLPTAGGVQYAGIWTSDAVHLDIWQDIKHRVTERDDKRFATQFFTSYSFAACRKEDKKVVKIACDI